MARTEIKCTVTDVATALAELWRRVDALEKQVEALTTR